MNIEGGGLWTKGPAQEVRDELALELAVGGREQIAAIHIGIVVDNVMRDAATRLNREFRPNYGLKAELLAAGLEPSDVEDDERSNIEMAERAAEMLVELGEFNAGLRLKEAEAARLMRELYPAESQ